ncbi:YcxB family protein [Lacibacterium aquatile]|uniref:YcxB family protein n=1 Tax=Lacibacterium aquatile TaxID=1168082 RepID=A0ABW5DL96_9PROT
MTISFGVRAGDFWRAIFVMAFARKHLLRWLIIAFLGVILFATPLSSAEARYFIAAMVSVVTLAICIFLWYGGRSYLRLHREPIRVSWTESGIEVVTAKTRRQSGWESVKRWQEGAGVILLYFSDLDCLIIPRRSFELEETLIEFRRHLARCG